MYDIFSSVIQHNKQIIMISFGKKSSYLPHHPAINVYCDLEYITDPLTCTGNAEGIA